MGTNEVLAYSVTDAGFYVQQFDWKEGKQIIVQSQKVLSDKKYQLEHTPIGNILVKMDSEVCDASKVKVNNLNVVDYSACVEDSTSTVRISYKYVVSHMKNFQFDAQLVEGGLDQVNWKVFVNGNETDAYIRNGADFQISEDVVLGSIISIQAK